MRLTVQLLIVCWLSITASPVVFAQAPGSTPSNPAPAGTTLSGIIECGEGYTSHELYDIKITLLEVLRGEAAWKRIQAAGGSSKPAETGKEYLLARIKYEFFARGIPGTCVHPLAPDEFTAYSRNGEDYPAPVVVPPKPELRKALKSGESFEGWLAFAVSKDDKEPLMLYSADSGGAVEHGGGKWFLLR